MLPWSSKCRIIIMTKHLNDFLVFVVLLLFWVQLRIYTAHREAFQCSVVARAHSCISNQLLLNIQSSLIICEGYIHRKQAKGQGYKMLFVSISQIARSNFFHRVNTIYAVKKMHGLFNDRFLPRWINAVHQLNPKTLLPWHDLWNALAHGKNWF